MRIGQVGDRELAALGVAGVAVTRELRGPVPAQVAQLGGHAEAVVEANLCDAMDVAQRLGKLHVGRVVEPAREGRDDLGLAEADAARAAHREDERKAEACVVRGVQRLDAREFLGRAGGQASLALLVGRLGRQRLRNHGLAGQFRVGANQRKLRIASGFAHHLDQRALEMRQAGKRGAGSGALRNPRRVLVDAFEQPRQFIAGCGVHLRERDGCGSHAVTPRRTPCRR